MSKGTILYVGGFELPDKNAAAHRVLSNGKIFRELGYEVVFIDVDRKLQNKTDIYKTKKETQKFEYWSRPYPKSNREWIHYLIDANSVINILLQYKNIKAIICYNYQSIPLIKLKKYCRNNNIKIFSDCTEWYSTKGANAIFKLIKGVDTFLRMRIIQKQLDGLIVISNLLYNYYDNNKNVVRIPPLVDLSEEKWNIKIQKTNSSNINIVYAGSPGKNKDSLNVIIEALDEINEEVPNYTLNIVGITKEQYLNDYRHHQKVLDRLGKRIIFNGRLSHTESLQYIKNAHFSMFFRENSRVNNAGFPTKFAESISIGTPVLTNVTSDLEEFLVEGKNGFFLNTLDKELMISKLKGILNLDNRKIEEMKQACISSEMFNYKRYIENLNLIVKEIG